MELYNPDVTRERLGYDSHESLRLLREWGFRMKLVHRQDTFPIFRPEDMDSHFDRLVSCHLLVATKCWHLFLRLRRQFGLRFALTVFVLLHT